MSLDWCRYEPYRPPYSGPLAQLSRSEARESFDLWLAARSGRWVQLQRLLETVGVALGTSDADVQRLNDWFRASVEANPEDGSRLANRWYAVVNDLAVVLGDMVIQRCPGLTWEFFTRGGKRDVSFQKHVVTGFTKVPNPKFNLDAEGLVATYAYQIIAGDKVPEDYFVSVLAAAEAVA